MFCRLYYAHPFLFIVPRHWTLIWSFIEYNVVENRRGFANPDIKTKLLVTEISRVREVVGTRLAAAARGGECHQLTTACTAVKRSM